VHRVQGVQKSNNEEDEMKNGMETRQQQAIVSMLADGYSVDDTARLVNVSTDEVLAVLDDEVVRAFAAIPIEA
jgi:DNA-binding NarL/FixJ family response regulator